MIMSKLLNEWIPSDAAIELIKLNGVTDAQIESSLKYLKSQNNMQNIDDIDGYDNWNAFFIIFCIKAHKPDEEK